MSDSLSALLIATVSIAFIHALAPDHWLPFVMIGKAQQWSRARLSVIAGFSGFAHVGSSVALGVIGILLGWASVELQGVEATRSEIGVLLLVGFGIAYTVWGLRRARHHHHHKLDLSDKKNVTLWTLFAVFVLGPCEPLIPLMFLATSFGTSGILMVTLVFGTITVAMMVVQSLLGYAGIQFINHKIAERYSHALAGLVIFLTGAFIYFV